MSSEIDKMLKNDQSSLLTCAVCQEMKVGRSPRGLHCLHTFCQVCLDGLSQGNPSITCPMCKEVTPLTDNDINKLPIDFYVNALASALGVSPRQPRVPRNRSTNRKTSMCFDKPFKLVARCSMTDPCVGVPSDLVSLNDGTAVVVYRGMNYATRIDLMGRDMANYYCPNNVEFVSEHDGKLFLFSSLEKAVFGISLCQRERSRIKVDISEIISFSIFSDGFLFGSDRPNNKLCEFSLKNNKKITKYRELFPFQIRKCSVKGNSFYVVCSGQEDLLILNAEREDHRKVALCKLSSKSDTFVTDAVLLENGNILACDPSGQRLTEYGQDGSVIRHLLKRRDGLQHPYRVAYRHPWLWVAGRWIDYQNNEQGSISLYKFYEGPNYKP